MVATGIGIQCYLFGAFSAHARAKAFSSEFFDAAFPSIPVNERNVSIY